KQGSLGLTLDGARRRDLAVAAALAGTASVWLPGGGYHADAWKVLAGTGMALTGHGREPIRRRYDPLASRFATIFGGLEPARLGGGADFTQEDIEAELARSHRDPRFLDFYTAQGLEYGLHRYGVLDYLGRLGYGAFRVEVERSASGGDRARLYG